MIIDTHAHLGHDIVFDEYTSEDLLVSTADRYKVDLTIVQPAVPRPYIEDTRAIHDEIFALAGKYPGKFAGMASINPHFRADDYEKELTRCVKELGFVGTKITPIAHACDPGGSSCMFVYELCRKLDIPVMIHTGAGMPFADPIKILKPAKSFRDVTFILAHSGTDLMFTQALYVAEQCENVFLEPSWLNICAVKAAAASIGAGRIMFSSDVPDNLPVELVKYKTAFEGEDLDWILFKTAMKAFKLKSGGEN